MEWARYFIGSILLGLLLPGLRICPQVVLMAVIETDDIHHQKKLCLC